MINKHTELATIEQHITPHMFRHIFASSLLDEDINIRYIQEIFDHSSSNTNLHAYHNSKATKYIHNKTSSKQI